MSATTPPVAVIHAELERARHEFRQLVQTSSSDVLLRRSLGTRWTNRELLFHMMFGYLISRDLRPLVKIVSRLPGPWQQRFAAALNAATRPFDQINYWGSRAGGRTISPQRMACWLDRVIASMHRHLQAETEAELRRSMAFPTRWDPYFAECMTLTDVYHYATVHFDHHRNQLTVAD